MPHRQEPTAFPNQKCGMEGSDSTHDGMNLLRDLNLDAQFVTNVINFYLNSGRPLQDYSRSSQCLKLLLSSCDL